MERIFDLANLSSIHEARKTQINQFANVSRITLLLYDMLLNLDREKRYVWEAEFGLSSVLYYVLRYPVIAFQFFCIFMSPALPHCDALYKFTFTISITLTRIAICISFVLRVYAVLPKRIIYYATCAFLSVVGMLSVALDIVQTVQQSCRQPSASLSQVLTFICLMCFDVITTALMSWGIICILKDRNEVLRGISLRKLMAKWSTIAIITRSGILYFLVITGLQLGAVILYWLPQGVYSEVLNYHLITLSTILVSRFLLDLREHVNKENSSSIGRMSLFEQSIQFAPMASHAEARSKALTSRWIEEFGFETCHPTNCDYLEADTHLNPVACPLNTLNHGGRKIALDGQRGNPNHI